MNIFDRAVTAIKNCEMVSMSITVVAPEVDKIREILDNSEPYNDIPKLPALTTALEQATETGSSELKKKADEARKLEEERRKAEDARNKQS